MIFSLGINCNPRSVEIKFRKAPVVKVKKKIEESLNFKEATTRTFFLSGFCSFFSFSFSQIVLNSLSFTH